MTNSGQITDNAVEIEAIIVTPDGSNDLKIDVQEATGTTNIFTQIPLRTTDSAVGPMYINLGGVYCPDGIYIALSDAGSDVNYDVLYRKAQ